MIELKNISIVFNPNTSLEKTVLDNVNLTIASEEFIAVLGANGAGKSTLLKLIAGEVSPSQGQIFIDGKDVTKLSIEQRAPFIGHVYQDPRLGTCEMLTIEENMALAYSRGERRGLGSAVNKQLRAEFKEILRLLNLGLENRLQEHVSLLSGGQRQALSLVMATLRTPKILLLDEHTAALDPKTAKTVLALTCDIVRTRKLTTLMITHNMEQAKLGNKVLMFKDDGLCWI